ncbi:hypothetical protein [Xanthomonas sp. 1678]|uniref:hypothetical protein n=1 Tax=Xanthomonas sp. 1678 TaxID=3158788 RepID=UPI0028564E5D|nr:hypothetical protein [Xanthomonas translucens]
MNIDNNSYMTSDLPHVSPCRQHTFYLKGRTRNDPVRGAGAFTVYDACCLPALARRRLAHATLCAGPANA